MLTVEIEFTDEMVAACAGATGLTGQDAVAKVVQDAIAPLHRAYCVREAIAPAQAILNAAIDKAQGDLDQARASFKALLDKAQTDADAAFDKAVA